MRIKKCTGRQNALKSDQTCLLQTLPRWSLRAALGQAEVEVEGDVHRVKTKAGKQPHEKLLTSPTLAQTVPERHSS